MPLPETPLSQVCRSIAGFLSERLEASQNHIHVTLGTPSEAPTNGADSLHRVNLFFYRMEPLGFGPAADPDEPWRLRLHCLITSFSVQEEQISAGENDLRLLGGVLRAFHEQPLLDAVAVNGEEVRVQVVFQPLSTEEINHLWSTQGDIAYRPSVAYEVALVPVLPRVPRLGGPLVGALGFEARAGMASRRAPFSGTAAPPQVARFLVDAGREDWAPRVCLVRDGTCAESLSFAVGSQELTDFVPRVWTAGEVGSAVLLVWEVWDHNGGWRQEGGTVMATALTEAIDPEAPSAEAGLAEVELPFDDHAGQAVLYAERQYTRGSDGAQLTVRSNPLLVNLFFTMSPL
jgi:hypothetical protein